MSRDTFNNSAPHSKMSLTILTQKVMSIINKILTISNISHVGPVLGCAYTLVTGMYIGTGTVVEVGI